MKVPCSKKNHDSYKGREFLLILKLDLKKTKYNFYS